MFYSQYSPESWLYGGPNIDGAYIGRRITTYGKLRAKYFALPLAWRNTVLSYNLGQIVTPTTGLPVNRHYECIVAGLCGVVEPTWPSTIGTTVNDNAVTWMCRDASGGFGYGGVIPIGLISAKLILKGTRSGAGYTYVNCYFTTSYSGTDFSQFLGQAVGPDENGLVTIDLDMDVLSANVGQLFQLFFTVDTEQAGGGLDLDGLQMNAINSYLWENNLQLVM
jgi:hypothetical protein